MSEPSEASGRRRIPHACRRCRQFKRKCDGHQPCGTCTRYEYECSFTDKARKARRPLLQISQTRSLRHQDEDQVLPSTGRHDPVRSLEANSGAASFRRAALNLDPANAPRLHTFAWNAFLGSRNLDHVSSASAITEILSERDLRRFSLIYFQKVDPIYGFLQRDYIEHIIVLQWQTYGTQAPPDAFTEAILCGIAALGILYSCPNPIKEESQLVELARITLESGFSAPPTIASISGWILRVVYLRVCGVHHAAWMASCMLIHMVEAAGLHWEQSDDAVLQQTIKIGPEHQRRIVAVSQHLNIWTSFDIGRSRAILCNATVRMPSPRPGDQTVELMELIPYAEQLDPEKAPSSLELQEALSTVVDRIHSTPPSVLAQTNLIICLCRRLQSLNCPIGGETLDKVLALTSAGVRAAQTICDDHAPWHHMANIPFQVICLLLTIDTYTSISQLPVAIQCLSNVATVYQTDATKEALNTASMLIMLYKKRKESSVSVLDDALQYFPAGQDTSTTADVSTNHSYTIGVEDFLPSSNFDLDQFLIPSFLKD